MAETEAIFVLATDGQRYFNMRLAVPPAVKETVINKGSGKERVAGTATRLEWPAASNQSVTVPVRVEIANRYAAAELISPQFVRELIMQGQHLGAYRLGDDYYAWEGLTYIPVGITIAVPQAAGVQPTNTIEVCSTVAYLNRSTDQVGSGPNLGRPHQHFDSKRLPNP